MHFCTHVEGTRVYMCTYIYKHVPHVCTVEGSIIHGTCAPVIQQKRSIQILVPVVHLSCYFRRSIQMPPMQTYLTSWYSSNPWWEPSLPKPLSLMPPKGAASVLITPSFTPIIPYSKASATRKQRPTSRL